MHSVRRGKIGCRLKSEVCSTFFWTQMPSGAPIKQTRRTSIAFTICYHVIRIVGSRSLGERFAPADGALERSLACRGGNLPGTKAPREWTDLHAHHQRSQKGRWNSYGTQGAVVNVATKMFDENRRAGLMICGINWGAIPMSRNARRGLAFSRIGMSTFTRIEIGS